MAVEESTRERLPVLEDWIAALLPWGWSERLSLVGLGSLLAGVALPWGRDAADQSRQLVEHEQVGWLGVCLAVLVVAVPTRLTVPRRYVVATIAIGLAAALAPALSLLVAERPGDTLPLLVPGRLAVLLGALCLVVAVLAPARVPARMRRSAASPPSSTARTVEARFERAVTGLGALVGGSALGGAALALVAAGAATVLGPWWFGPMPALQPGAVRASRSGLQELGDVRTASVALAVVVAAAAFVYLGGRRGAPFVAVAGAVATAAMMSGAVGVPAGRTVVPLVGTAAAAAGVALAIIVVWPSWRSGTWMPSHEPPPATLAELADAVERRAQWDADRWIALGALGLGTVAVSTLLYWRVGAIPIGPISRTDGSKLLCLGIVVGMAALAAARFRPWTDVTAAAATLMLTAAGMVAVSWSKLTAVDVGSATFLALLGALGVFSAAVAPLRRLEETPPRTGGPPKRVERDPTANRGPSRRINVWRR
jgi:hypothetical protein